MRRPVRERTLCSFARHDSLPELPALAAGSRIKPAPLCAQLHIVLVPLSKLCASVVTTLRLTHRFERRTRWLHAADAHFRRCDADLPRLSIDFPQPHKQTHKSSSRGS